MGKLLREMTEDTTKKDSRPIGWEGDAVETAFAKTGIRFNLPNAEVLAKFKAPGRDVTFDDGGVPHTLYDREVLPLVDALTRWAADDVEGVCDRRTLPRSPGGGRNGIASREDLPDAKSRVAYIDKHGLEAFEALPTKHQPTEELRYRDQFRELPLSEKSRLIRQHGEDFVRNLPARPTGQPRGGYINREALERQKRIRPNG